jgi:hypothetical protein
MAVHFYSRYQMVTSGQLHFMITSFPDKKPLVPTLQEVEGATTYDMIYLTHSNPIFLPTAYSPALICFGRGRGWWSTCNYSTVLKRKNGDTERGQPALSVG